MAEPKKKSTRSGRKIRYHLNLPKYKNLTPCTKCQYLILPHQVCPVCGTYKGIKMIELRDLKARRKKREEKEKSVQ